MRTLLVAAWYTIIVPALIILAGWGLYGLIQEIR